MSNLPRCDFVLLFDCQDGNPNGDPDAGNMPRVDPETQHGLVSDVCQKRKVRDWVYLSQREADGSLKPGFDIFFGHSGIPDRRILNDQIEAAHKKAVEAPAIQERMKALKKDGDKKQVAAQAARTELCATRFDIRTFGAVLSTGDFSAGQVRGPMQCTFARSVDPILGLEACITRKAVTKAEDAEGQMKEHGEIVGTMGRKHLIPYGLFQSHWFFSPLLAKDTGFGAADLKIVCEALLAMFETDRSASRGMMATRELVVFRHDSALGNARAQTLFDRVRVQRKAEVTAARRFTDYDLQVDLAGLPSGVQGYRLADDVHRAAFYKSLE
jgi:CRISPR-associated protein Csd2